MNQIDVDEAVRRLSAGEMIILTDGSERGNASDMFVLADKICSRHLGFMICYAEGRIYVPISCKIADQFQLVPMAHRNTDAPEEEFIISVDAADSKTGDSIESRVETVRRLADPLCIPEALARPGYVYPLVAKKGESGESSRSVRAAVDLAGLCGTAEAGVICGIRPEAAGKHGLGVLSIEDLEEYLKK